MKSLLIISSKSPYGSDCAQEALDAALTASAFTTTRLLFIRDGVLQLLDGQQARQVGRKQFTAGFAALAHYGVTDVFVCEESLARRGLTGRKLVIAAQPAGRPELRRLLQTHEQVLSF